MDNQFTPPMKLVSTTKSGPEEVDSHPRINMHNSTMWLSPRYSVFDFSALHRNPNHVSPCLDWPSTATANQKYGHFDVQASTIALQRSLVSYLMVSPLQINFRPPPNDY